MTTDTPDAVRADDIDDATVALTALVDAEPERAFAAFTDPTHLAAWFWPERLATRYETDVRAGGRYSIVAEKGDMAVSGTYLEVTPPQRLVMTWTWDDERTSSEVLVEIREAGAGSEVRVTHGGNATVDGRVMHRQGWTDCLERLVAHLRSGDTPPTTTVE